MKNSPYLDKPFIPLAVALRSMLAETEAKLATAAPAEKAGSNRGPRCCGSGLSRNQQSRSRPSRGRGQIGDPGSAQPPAPIRPVDTSVGAHRWVCGWARFFPLGLPAQLLHASPDSRKVVGGTRSVHVCFPVGRDYWLPGVA
jgi:hypothetical protein